MRERWLRAIALAVVVFSIVTPALSFSAGAAPIPNIVYVAATGSDAAGCGEIDAPCRTIQQAVNIATDYDEIRVAEGVYTYEPTVDPCPNDGTTGVVCLVDRQLTIRGGYAPDWSSQDPENHPSIIDGQQQHRGVMVLRTALTTRLEMEGFVIENGYAAPISGRLGDEGTFAFGGGLFADMGATPLPGNEVILERVVFRNNVAVGATVSGVYGGSGVGGGVALRAIAFCRLEDVRFEGNEARSGCGSQRGGYAIGGGLHAGNSFVYAYDVEFVGNRAIVPPCNVNGQAADQFGDALGGGVATQGIEMTLQNVIVEGNLAQGGNAISYAGGAFGGGVFGEHSNLTIYDSIVRENVARGGDAHDGGLAGGGGIDAHNTTVSIHRAQIVGNLAQGGSSTGGGKAGGPGGGGLYLVRFTGEDTATISNSIIAANEVQFGAAGSTLGGGGGAGLWLQGIASTLTHLTIADNTLGGQPMQGNAILVLSDSTAPRPVYVDSTIIANHSSANGTGAVYAQPNNTIQLNRTLWACNDMDTNAGQPDSGPIYDNDRLSACPAGFVAPGAPLFDYHLSVESPAIDQASNSLEAVDIDSDMRPTGLAPDIGADEVLLDTLSLQVARPGSGMLHAIWEAGGHVAQITDHYDVMVDCPQGARSPLEGSCGEPISVGLATDLLLTQLSDGMSYTITVHAYDCVGELLKTSNTVVAQPTAIFRVFLPFVSR
ncbi:MAG: hypothetical protein JXA93_08270 [Anaerolineae bacterium]|nr:hypothetical protein [Anaerolineae bacterium]